MRAGSSPTVTGPPQDAFGSGRCANCQGALSETRVTGQPQQRDHLPGCKFYDRAVQVMRYVSELRRAASGSTNRDASHSRRRRRYLQKSAKELQAAACTENPVLAVGGLADIYAVERERNNKLSQAAGMLSEACHDLAQGKDPAPITLDQI